MSDTTETLISLDTITLRGQSMHLLLSVVATKLDNGYRFIISVPLSEYHPRTDLLDLDEVKTLCLFKCSMKIVSDDPLEVKKFAQAQSRLGFTASLALFIEYMYLITKCFSCTVEEKVAFLGLERKSLYIGLKHITVKYGIDIYDSMILYALPEYCSDTDSRLDKYLNTDYEKLFEYYKTICPNKRINRLTMGHIDISKSIVAYENKNRERLYMTNIIGMCEVDEDTMATSLNVLMEKCMYLR